MRRINEMLATLPDYTRVNMNIIEAFAHVGPLTIDKFQQVAESYNLPMPSFEESASNLTVKKDIHGNVYHGQFNRIDGFGGGIIRKVSDHGDVLLEYVLFGKTPIGLAR